MDTGILVCRGTWALWLLKQFRSLVWCTRPRCSVTRISRGNRVHRWSRFLWWGAQDDHAVDVRLPGSQRASCLHCTEASPLWFVCDGGACCLYAAVFKRLGCPERCNPYWSDVDLGRTLPGGGAHRGIPGERSERYEMIWAFWTFCRPNLETSLELIRRVDNFWYILIHFASVCNVSWCWCEHMLKLHVWKFGMFVCFWCRWTVDVRVARAFGCPCAERWLATAKLMPSLVPTWDRRADDSMQPQGK